MTDTVRDIPHQSGLDGLDGAATSFSGPIAQDRIVVINVTRGQTRRLPRSGEDPSKPPGTTASTPVGAFVISDGRVRWRPAVDVTRLLVTAEVMAGAVLIASRLARRPSAAKALVTMGPGGWVSMKGGAVAVRPASRPWGRPRPVSPRGSRTRRPVWARLLSAVPLRSLLT